MDQRVLGELATRAAELAERQDSEALDELVRVAGSAYGYAPWAVTNLIAGEWERQRAIPARILLPRGTRLAG